METSAAILLRKTKLTETSLIITWFTEGNGRMKTVAQGARRPKSRFAGVLDLFFECEIQFSRSKKSELHMLREVVLKASHEALRLEYRSVAVASYFVELVELVTEPDHPAPEIFGLLRRAFTFLDGHSATKRAVLHFESELVRLLGIQHPQLLPAIAIGRTYHAMPGGRTALLSSLSDGQSVQDPRHSSPPREGTKLDAGSARRDGFA